MKIREVWIASADQNETYFKLFLAEATDNEWPTHAVSISRESWRIGELTVYGDEGFEDAIMKLAAQVSRAAKALRTFAPLAKEHMATEGAMDGQERATAERIAQWLHDIGNSKDGSNAEALHEIASAIRRGEWMR